MPTAHFTHGFGFDPTYGYTLDSLLQLPPPPEPADFATFWQNLFTQARAMRVAPQLREIINPVPKQRVFTVEYTSLGNFHIKGWLTVPRDEPVERGAIIGHGYGGRDGPDRELPIARCAALFPCARGLSLSAHPTIPADPAGHVLYGIQNRHAYILGGCAADIWCGATALLELFPAAAARLDYLGISFGGGVGALALPWDERFHGAHLCVPSFGNHPLRLDCHCVGSGEAVRIYHRERGGIALEVLRYFDAASAARYLHIPMHIAAARFDPAVPPPGQFSIYNAIGSPKRLFVLSAGHFDYPDQAAEQHKLLAAFRHPHLFKKVVSLSGRFDLTAGVEHFRDLFDGHYDEQIYYNTPSHFVPNLGDDRILNHFRNLDIVLVVGDQDPFLDNNRRLSTDLWNKGIWHALYLWNGRAHNPYYWRQMVGLYV